MQFKYVIPGVLGAVALAAAVVAAPNSVNSAAIQDGQVKTADIGAGQIWQSQMAGPVNDVYLKTYNNTVGDPQLKADVRSQLALGKAAPTVTLAPKVIDNLGGKYFGDTTATSDDRYTKVGSFTLPAGKWQVTVSAKFHRTAAGVAGTRPQLGLRIGQDQTLDGDAKWGVDAGTVGGSEISPAAGRDLFGMDSKTITLTGPTEIEADGFGYNDDQSDAGSGQITVGATITAVLVG